MKNYLKKCSKWIALNEENLKALHTAFQTESGSAIEFNAFCLQMFKESKEGIKAARQQRQAEARKARHEAMLSVGLVRVRGALGGTYYE